MRCMPSHLTEFSIKQWLLQRLFTALAVLRTSQSHLETEQSLCLIPLATQLQDSKLCLDESFSSGSNCSLQSIQAIKKEREKSIAKALGISRWKEQKQDMITFSSASFSVCHTLAVYLQTKLKPEYLPQT